MSSFWHHIIIFGIIQGLISAFPTINQDLPKVFQNGSTSGIAFSTSASSANMVASGYPSGIINTGGTGATWNGTSTVTQDLNSSTSVGGSLASNCQGGMVGTYIAGQEGIGLNASGNCESIVIPT